jgi:hypothetical protein
MGEVVTMTQTLDSFTRQYLETALWSSVDDDGKPLDDVHDVSDFAPEAIARAVEDCKAFRETHAADLGATHHDDYDRHAHDLWLTRNGHGTGFWDREYGEVGDRLTDAAHACGECYLYVGDDGLLYFG